MKPTRDDQRRAPSRQVFPADVDLTPIMCLFIILVPLLLATGPGAEIQRPLATVVAGGLLTSTLVTLVVLPLVYQSLVERGAAPVKSGRVVERGERTR